MTLPASPPPPPPPPVAPPVAIATHADALPPPRTAFHRRLQDKIEALETIADNIANVGRPHGEVMAFYMCAFNRLGAPHPAASGWEAAWLRSALTVSTVQNIAQMNAETFRHAMRARFNALNPTNRSPLMNRIDDDDLIAIHDAASSIWAAIQP